MSSKNIVDKNLTVNVSESEIEKDSYTLPHPLFDQYGGIFYDEEYKHWLRLEKEWADGMSWGLNVLKHMTCGGRTRFSTDSSLLEIEVTTDDLWIFTTIPLTSASGFLLMEDLDDGTSKYVMAFRPSPQDKNYFKQDVKLPGGKMRNYTLWWPMYHKITGVTLNFAKGSKISHGAKYRDIKPILYYGSSITQGCCSSRCDTSYEGFINKWNNVDFVNMGFSGNAFGEIKMAEYLATHFDPSIFVYDYDYNAESCKQLEETHLPFFLKYRELKPNTPIVMISMPSHNGDKNSVESSEKRMKIIKKTYNYAKNHGDKNVYFINGQKFFTGFFANVCQIDSDHPTDLGFYLMAKKINKTLKKIIK